MEDMSLSPKHHRNNNTNINAPKAPAFNIPLRFAGGSSRHASPEVNMAAPLVQKRVAPPVKFVEPSHDDIKLRGVPDPNSPNSAPRINPWSADYSLGDITLYF